MFSTVWVLVLAKFSKMDLRNLKQKCRNDRFWSLPNRFSEYHCYVTNIVEVFQALTSIMLPYIFSGTAFSVYEEIASTLKKYPQIKERRWILVVNIDNTVSVMVYNIHVWIFENEAVCRFPENEKLGNLYVFISSFLIYFTGKRLLQCKYNSSFIHIYN